MQFDRNVVSALVKIVQLIYWLIQRCERYAEYVRSMFRSHGYIISLSILSYVYFRHGIRFLYSGDIILHLSSVIHLNAHTKKKMRKTPTQTSEDKKSQRTKYGCSLYMLFTIAHLNPKCIVTRESNGKHYTESHRSHGTISKALPHIYTHAMHSIQVYIHYIHVSMYSTYT